MNEFLNNDELYHHGTKGQKWGIRRYQNPDGSLTAAGKKRYGTKANFEKVQRAKLVAKGKDPKSLREKARAKAKARAEKEVAKYEKKKGKIEENKKTKSLSEMSDEEIRAAINRKNLENQYRQAFPERVTAGQKLAKGLKNYAVNVITEGTKKAASDFIDKKLRDTLGLNVKDELDILKTEAQKAEYESKIYKAKTDKMNYERDKEKNDKSSSTTSSESSKEKTSSKKEAEKEAAASKSAKDVEVHKEKINDEVRDLAKKMGVKLTSDLKDQPLATDEEIEELIKRYDRM